MPIPKKLNGTTIFLSFSYRLSKKVSFPPLLKHCLYQKVTLIPLIKKSNINYFFTIISTTTTILYKPHYFEQTFIHILSITPSFISGPPS